MLAEHRHDVRGAVALAMTVAAVIVMTAVSAVIVVTASSMVVPVSAVTARERQCEYGRGD
jgi:hypothetical protein